MKEIYPVNDIFCFKPKYSKVVNLINGDGFEYQISGKDEDGKYQMYNNSAEMIEENKQLMVAWNGAHFTPEKFFDCDFLDGDFEFDSVKITHNIYSR